MPTGQDSNLSLVLHSVKDIRLEDRPVPKPGPHDVLLEMQKVGICGSDVHFWQKGCIGDFVSKAPLVLGHEPSGLVIAVGDKVTHLKVGDRVAVEPGVPCSTCSYCKSDRYHLCPEVKFASCPPYDGALARYFVHAADFCFKLPDNVSFEEGALVEPFSVGLYACQRGKVKEGSLVLVCGAGPIGLATLLAAKALGAAKVVITDVTESRLQVACALGADASVNVGNKDPKTAAAEVSAALGEQVDITIECCGAEPATQLGIYATRPGGVLVLVGLGAAEMKVPLLNALLREVDIRGVFRYVNCYPLAIDLIASGRVNIKPLITHRFPLEQALEAFETARTGAGGAIKVMINCSRNGK